MSEPKTAFKAALGLPSRTVEIMADENAIGGAIVSVSVNGVRFVPEAPLVEALKPFASHVGKAGAKVVLAIGGSTWTDTLKTSDFERARELTRKPE